MRSNFSRMIKKAFSLLISILMVSFCLGNHVLAADKQIDSDNSMGPWLGYAVECEYDLPENEDSSCQYFAFDENTQKIDSNGNFTFSFSWAMSSTTFKPAASKIRVYASATSSTSNKTYYITLKRFSDDASMGYGTYTANGTSQYIEFSGLDLYTSYYLYFSKPIISGATITGSGSVNYIQ